MTPREIKKKNIGISKLAREKKIDPGAAFGRIYRGWSVDDAINTPTLSMYKSGFGREWKSKEDFQLDLDDMPFNEIPKVLRQLRTTPIIGKLKFGRWVRRTHPQAFDKYYYDNFVPQKHVEVVKRFNSVHTAEARRKAKTGIQETIKA
jgi:hypothetical protein